MMIPRARRHDAAVILRKPPRIPGVTGPAVILNRVRGFRGRTRPELACSYLNRIDTAVLWHLIQTRDRVFAETEPLFSEAVTLHARSCHAEDFCYEDQLRIKGSKARAEEIASELHRIGRYYKQYTQTVLALRNHAASYFYMGSIPEFEFPEEEYCFPYEEFLPSKEVT